MLYLDIHLSTIASLVVIFFAYAFMKDIILSEILIPSLKRLYQEDYNNIKFGVSERNICARLAHHMENIMREYDAKNRTSFFMSYNADVEYNRMGNGDLKCYEDNQKRPRYMVSDLLIHNRGYEGNLLAVEMKKKGSTKKDIEEDKKCLMSMVTPGALSQLTGCVHDTLLGVFIEYSIKGVNMDFFTFSGEEKKVSISTVVLPLSELNPFFDEDYSHL